MTSAPDLDEAPEWADNLFERAEAKVGDTVVRAGGGTLTKRGRPKSDDPKIQVNLRLDRIVIERFREGGPGWQSRINEALKKAVGAPG
jgi:uncharacterized protein (DUF4415 family)